MIQLFIYFSWHFGADLVPSGPPPADLFGEPLAEIQGRLKTMEW